MHFLLLSLFPVNVRVMLAERAVRKIVVFPLRFWQRLSIARQIRQQIVVCEQSKIAALPAEQLRQRTFRFINDMAISDEPRMGFRYARSQREPVLYASLYAALNCHLYGALDVWPTETKASWLDSILAYQCNDGMFRDPAIDCPFASEVSWWGWQHLTLHAIMAVTALGGVVTRPFAFASRFLQRSYLIDWLESRNWRSDAVNVGNEVQNVGVILQYARDYQNDTAAGRAVEWMLDWLAARQDPQAGSWGTFPNTREGRSRCVQTGYHLWLLFFYDQRPVRHMGRIVDLALQTQNGFGGFGTRPNSSACEDIDSIDPLVRISLLTDYRRDEVLRALRRSVNWVLANFNQDGGAVFRRAEAFTYGHEKMHSGKDESALFPTWFRTLSLAYLGQVLGDLEIGKFNWQFLNCPGHQFWKP